MADTFLKSIYQSPQTVFSMRELLLMWGRTDIQVLYVRINRYVKNGLLYHLRRGLYAKKKDYNSFEVASKLMVPSYISFETVLLQAGVIFQYYSHIYSASYRTREIECDQYRYIYRRLKYHLLIQTDGIIGSDLYAIATPERAFLDMVYLRKSYYFDNLTALDWEKVYKIAPIYENIRMMERVKKYHKHMIQKNKEGPHG